MITLYKNIEYVIHYNEMTGTYCAYIKVPVTHKYHFIVDNRKVIKLGKIKSTIWNGYDAIDDIDVHGGFTFSRRITSGELNKGIYPQNFTPGSWIGWDYAHAGDLMTFPKLPLAVKRGLVAIRKKYPITEHWWNKKEVLRDVKTAINQLLKAK